MKISSRIYLIIICLTFPLFSCVNDMETVNKFIDTEMEPDFMGENVETLYSDSARLLMRLTAPVFKQYTSASEQRREFPEGLHVWFYEKTGELKAELTANWAKEDLATEIWEARSNVVITSAEGEVLETEQFFWDPGKGIVYSEKFTKATKKDGSITTGETFSANQDFTNIVFTKGRATIILNDDEPENQP